MMIFSSSGIRTCGQVTKAVYNIKNRTSQLKQTKAKSACREITDDRSKQHWSTVKLTICQQHQEESFVQLTLSCQSENVNVLRKSNSNVYHEYLISTNAFNMWYHLENKLYIFITDLTEAKYIISQQTLYSNAKERKCLLREKAKFKYASTSQICIQPRRNFDCQEAHQPLCSPAHFSCKTL